MYSQASSPKKQRSAGLTGVFITLFLLGMSLLFIAIFAYPSWRARLSGVQTQGTVVSVSDCTDDDSGDTVLHAMVAYDDNVEPTIQFTDIYGHTDQEQYDICGSYDVGETLTIWYVPSDPSSIFVPADTTSLLFLSIALGTLGAVSLLLLLFFVFRILFVLATGGRVSIWGNPFSRVSPAIAGNLYRNRMVIQGGRVINLSGAPPMMANQFPGSRNHPAWQPATVEGHWWVMPTSARPSQGDERTSAVPGRYFLLLNVTLRNVSQEPRYPSQAMFRLHDSLGTEYSRVQALESPFQASVQPGGTTELTLAFDVPSAQRQFQLNAVSSSTFATEATWDIAA